jgi:surface protein
LSKLAEGGGPDPAFLLAHWGSTVTWQVQPSPVLAIAGTSFNRLVTPSPEGNFVIATPSVTLIRLPDRAPLNPEFTWQQFTYAAGAPQPRYLVQVIKAAQEFANPQVTFNGIQGQIHTSPFKMSDIGANLEPGERYKWRVVAQNNGRLAYSETQEFRTLSMRLADNGVTVLCHDASLNQTDEILINGTSTTFTRRDRAGLEALLKENPNHPELATSCVSGVDDLSDLFKDNSTFNQPIASWDVSAVTTMESMFNAAVAFDQPIGNWDVSGVANMAGMFAGSLNGSKFNQDISGWDVRKVENMSAMFVLATAFDRDISGWNVTKVTDMSLMFAFASKFNQPIGKWSDKVGNVTTMAMMFLDATFVRRRHQQLGRR